MKTIKQAWGIISKAFFKNLQNPESKCIIVKSASKLECRITNYGLCNAINVLCVDGKISTLFSDKMYQQLKKCKPKNVGKHDFFWPLNEMGTLKRAQLAEKLAKKS